MKLINVINHKILKHAEAMHDEEPETWSAEFNTNLSGEDEKDDDWDVSG